MKSRNILGLAMCVLFLALTGALLCLPAWAQENQVKATPCTAPEIPEKFGSQADYQAFQARMDDYRTCVDQFVAGERAQLTIHQEAANRAIGEWNAFAAKVNALGPIPIQSAP